MTWRQTEPGIFVKDFDRAEKVYYKIFTSFKPLNREHWGIYAICTVNFGPSLNTDRVAILRSAWKALRITFPGLSLVPINVAKLYKVSDAQSVEEWAGQTFFVDAEKTPEEVIASAKPRDLPSLYYLPASSSVVFLSSHWRIDALGTCMLLDRFFSILEQPSLVEATPAPDERGKISPSLEDAAGSPRTSTEEMEKFAGEYIANFHKKAVQTSGFPFKGGPNTLPSNPAQEAVMFSPSSTKSLLAACKDRRISVTAAIHAALAETVFVLGMSESQAADFTTVMAVNLRPYLQPPYNSRDHACQTYVGSITPQVLRSKNFLERTASLMESYQGWYDGKLIKALRPIFKYHADALFAQRAPPPNPPSGVTLNSLGVIEKYFRSDYENGLKVERFHFGVTMMTRQTMLYAWTFRGQLTLSLNFNEAYYDGDVAKKILLHIKRVLEKELSVELDPVGIQ
uniref:Acyltransferase n=1 Tax=Monascus purpureus TaxID=5098 RepID=A0A5Q0TK08_MONPU|nr:acyltransferase [Monascus purpureus]